MEAGAQCAKQSIKCAAQLGQGATLALEKHSHVCVVQHRLKQRKSAGFSAHVQQQRCSKHPHALAVSTLYAFRADHEYSAK